MKQVLAFPYHWVIPGVWRTKPCAYPNIGVMLVGSMLLAACHVVKTNNYLSINSLKVDAKLSKLNTILNSWRNKLRARTSKLFSCLTMQVHTKLGASKSTLTVGKVWVSLCGFNHLTLRTSTLSKLFGKNLRVSSSQDAVTTIVIT